MGSKFFSKKVKVDGMVFDSKKEYQRWLELQELEKKGDICCLQRQVKFVLLPKQNGERAVTYVADYVYVYGDILVVEDVKSKYTKKQPKYILKRKLFKFMYCNKKLDKVNEHFQIKDMIFLLTARDDIKEIYFKEYE